MNFDVGDGDGKVVTESLEIANFFNGSDEDTTDTIDFHVGVYGMGSGISPASLGLGIPDTIIAKRIVHYCFGTLLVLIGIAGAVGNGLVLYVFTRYQRLRGGGGRLILSLACGDFLVSVLHFMPAYSSFQEAWSFGDMGCQLYAAAVGLGGMASLINLAAIATDRFSVIIGNPLPWLSGKKSCAAIWLFSLCLVFPPFVGWSRYVPEGLETSCSWDYTTRTPNNRSYYIYLLTFGFFVPVLAIIISYLGILWVVCKHSHKMNGVTRNGVTHNKKKPTKSDLRTTQVILTIIVFFVASWTPYAIVSFIGQFGPKSSLSPMSTALPAIFAKASVIYNPVIYGLSHPHFRSAIRMLKLRHFSRNRTNGPYDRYHHRYYLPGHHGAMKPLLCDHAKYNEERQKMRNNRQGGRFTQHPISHSRPPQTSEQETMRTFECSSEDEVLVNKKGWVVLRKFSPCPESNTTAKMLVFETGAILSCDVESTTYSEPDLLHSDFGKAKMSDCVDVCDYRWKKKSFQRKPFFRSENCLENMLQVNAGHKNADYVTSKPLCPQKQSKIVSLNSSGTKYMATAIGPSLVNNRHSIDEDDEECELHGDVCDHSLDHSFSCHNFASHTGANSTATNPNQGVFAGQYRSNNGYGNISIFTMWKRRSFFKLNRCSRKYPHQSSPDAMRLRRAICVRKRRKNRKQLMPASIVECSDAKNQENETQLIHVDEGQKDAVPKRHAKLENTVIAEIPLNFAQNVQNLTDEPARGNGILPTNNAVVATAKGNEKTDEANCAKQKKRALASNGSSSSPEDEMESGRRHYNTHSTGTKKKYSYSTANRNCFQPMHESSLIRNQNSSLDSTCLTSYSDDAEFTDAEDNEMEHKTEQITTSTSRFPRKFIDQPERSKNIGTAHGYDDSLFETVNFYENPYTHYQETSFSVIDSDTFYSCG